MKKIIRLTESELHSLVQCTLTKLLQEQQDNNLLLQTIAQSIIQQGQLDVNPGDNDADFMLQNNMSAYVTFEVLCDPYMMKGMKSYDYDVPDDPDEIIDKPEVEVGSIDYCNGEGECIQIHDNGIVKKALESVINVDYDDYDIPSEEDYFYYED